MFFFEKKNQKTLVASRWTIIEIAKPNFLFNRELGLILSS